MIKLSSSTGLYHDGWTDGSASLCFKSEGPVQIFLFLPNSAGLDAKKLIHIYHNSKSMTIEVTRGVLTPTSALDPIDGEITLHIVCEDLEPEIEGDLRPLGVYIARAGQVDHDPISLSRLFEEAQSGVTPHNEGAFAESIEQAKPQTATSSLQIQLASTISEFELNAVSKMFDREFYLSGFPIGDAPSDPVLHYLTLGCREGREPNPWFSGNHYLARHPDVAAAGMNPFVHFAIAGASEGRSLVRLGQVPAGAGAQVSLFDQLSSVTSGARSPMFAPLTSRTAKVRSDDPKAIAFYLPQFHPFPENDAWWGKGFTEWTNVSKAVPQFPGHYQPRLPGELGHYDLRLPEVMQRQIELARQFGIHGFCFHYYWFSGQRLLEKPLDMFLSRQDAAFDFPFCLCWANENWTRRWDGAEHDVLMRQSHDAADHLAVFNDLLHYMKDSRYIKVGNRPVVVVYRPSIIDELPAMVEIWRKRAREEGFDDIFLIATNAFGFSDYASIGFDALCEFPPHNVVASEVSSDFDLFNQKFDGKIFRYTEARDFSLKRLEKISQQPRHGRYFPTVMLGWDNEARKPGRGNVFEGADPQKFYSWFLDTLRYSQRAHNPDERMVFVNAWNEWGEGTYLEPDRWFGYAYLNAVAAAYDTLGTAPTAAVRPVMAPAAASRKPGVVFVHAFYHDLLPELSERLNNPWMRDQFDVVATVPPHWTYRQIQDALTMLRADTVLVTPNVGRDIFPFLQALQTIELSGYDIALKLHTKKSPHLQHGARWRQAILASLTGEREVAAVQATMAADLKVGMMAPRSLLMPFDNPLSLRDNQENIDNLIGRFGLTINHEANFVAGSMFWFRPAVFERLRIDPLGVDDFGPELGAIDGTIAHAFERLLPSIALQSGYALHSYESEAEFNPYL